MPIQQIAARAVKVELQTPELVRRFELREQTLREVGEFVCAIDDACKHEMEATSGASNDVTDIFDKLAMRVEPMLELILRHPIDGLGPATREFVEALTQSQRKTLITTQSELNGLQDDDTAKKVTAALQLSLAWRAAANAGTTGVGKLPTTSQLSIAASVPSKWTLAGLFAKCRTIWRGRNAAVG